MADITVTPGSVVKYGTSTTSEVVSGEAIDAGEIVYLSASDGKYYLTDSDDAAKDEASGIALSTAATGQPLVIQVAGEVNPGGTLAVGETYYVSENPGKLCSHAGAGAGKYITVVGVASSTSKLLLIFTVTSVVKA